MTPQEIAAVKAKLLATPPAGGATPTPQNPVAEAASTSVPDVAAIKAALLQQRPATPPGMPLAGATVAEKPNIVPTASLPDQAHGTAYYLPRAVADIFTSSTQKFGSTLGAAASVGLGTNKKMDAAAVSESDARFQLSRLLNDPKTSPEQKARIRQQLGMGANVGVATEQVADLNKTNRQVFGEGIGTGLEMIQGGGLKGTGPTAKLGLGQAAAKGAKTGAVYGGLGAASKAMEENKSAAEIATSTALGSAVGAGVGAATGTLDALGAPKRAADAQKKADKASGQIAQSKVDEVEQHRRALTTITKDEAKGIKTYADLNNVLDEKVKALKAVQDVELGRNPNPQAIDNFSRSVGEGKYAVQSNPVTRALDHLEELYRRTYDDQALSQVMALKDKARDTGLTAAEVNQIARDYGSEFSRKAFNPKTGDALTSVNAQGFENTRSAVKDAARSLLPDDRSRELDASMANLLDLKRSTEKIEESVNGLANKIRERGLFQRVGRILGIATNKLTGGSLGAFLTALLPSNVGNKEMNSLDIQSALTRNIKILQKMEDAGDDELLKILSNLTTRGLGKRIAE